MSASIRNLFGLISQDGDRSAGNNTKQRRKLPSLKQKISAIFRRKHKSPQKEQEDDLRRKSDGQITRSYDENRETKKRSSLDETLLERGPAFHVKERLRSSLIEPTESLDNKVTTGITTERVKVVEMKSDLEIEERRESSGSLLRAILRRESAAIDLKDSPLEMKPSLDISHTVTVNSLDSQMVEDLMNTKTLRRESNCCSREKLAHSLQFSTLQLPQHDLIDQISLKSTEEH